MVSGVMSREMERMIFIVFSVVIMVREIMYSSL